MTARTAGRIGTACAAGAGAGFCASLLLCALGSWPDHLGTVINLGTGAVMSGLAAWNTRRAGR